MSDFKIEWHGEEIADAVEDEVKKAILKSGKHLQGESIQEAPIESGDLRGDCTVDDSRLNSDLTVKVGYSLPYALRQHEEIEYSHIKTDGYRIKSGVNAGKTVNMVAGGKAKFLEDPYNRNISKYIKFIANAVKRAFK